MLQPPMDLLPLPPQQIQNETPQHLPPGLEPEQTVLVVSDPRNVDLSLLYAQQQELTRSFEIEPCGFDASSPLSVSSSAYDPNSVREEEPSSTQQQQQPYFDCPFGQEEFNTQNGVVAEPRYISL